MSVACAGLVKQQPSRGHPAVRSPPPSHDETNISLSDMLVSSSFSKPQCPRTVQQQREKRGWGRPAECRACDGGLKRDACMSQDVVYSMTCTICQLVKKNTSGKQKGQHARGLKSTTDKPRTRHWESHGETIIDKSSTPSHRHRSSRHSPIYKFSPAGNGHTLTAESWRHYS